MRTIYVPVFLWLKIIGGVFVGLLLLVGVLSSVYQIEPEERGVVLRFGKFVDISEPGLHFKIPFGVDKVEIVFASQRVLKEEFGFRTRRVSGSRTEYSKENFADESLILTGDLNIIDVEWVVQYSIQDPEKYLFNIRDPEDTIRDTSEAVMRRAVGNRLGSDVLTRGRMEVALQVREELQAILDTYDSGIKVGNVELQDVVPPQRVQPAFNEVNVARQELERMVNEAEKRRNQQVPRATGQAQQLVSEAEGYSTERVNRSRGETARFLAVLEEYRKAPDVTRERLFLESMSKVLPKVDRIVVLPNEEGGTPLPLMNLDPIRGITPTTGANRP